MPKDKTNLAILIVLIAGTFWSFGALVVRYIEDAQNVPWQYVFFRGITIFLLLNLYLFLKEGKVFLNNYSKVGLSGIIGGVSLGSAMMCFIWSIIWSPFRFFNFIWHTFKFTFSNISKILPLRS